MEMMEKDQSKETTAGESVFQNLESFLHSERSRIIAKYADLYIEEDVIDPIWRDNLIEFATRSVEDVKPSTLDLNDKMDITEYVKILCVPWGEAEDSAYVNGVVMKKGLADKRMKTQILNPQILLISEAEGREEGAELHSLKEVVKYEDHPIKIMSEKISRLKPDIVVVEHDTSRQALDLL